MFYRIDSERKRGCNIEYFYITEIGGKVNKIVADDCGNTLVSTNRKEMLSVALMLNLAEGRKQQNEN